MAKKEASEILYMGVKLTLLHQQMHQPSHSVQQSQHQLIVICHTVVGGL